MKTTTKIGDIFSVELDNQSKRYFQYIVNDLTQLNSDVIRVFKKTYAIADSSELTDIIKDEVDFYCHVITKLGIKMGLWKKVGNNSNVGGLDHIIFRGTSDSGSKPGEQIQTSQKWYIWKINDANFFRVGKLEKEYQKAELGIVVNPYDVITRMKTGTYGFFYPGY
jgi:hypothetical protein